jgi:hypothetical protein
MYASICELKSCLRSRQAVFSRTTKGSWNRLDYGADAVSKHLAHIDIASRNTLNFRITCAGRRPTVVYVQCRALLYRLIIVAVSRSMVRLSLELTIIH